MRVVDQAKRRLELFQAGLVLWHANQYSQSRSLRITYDVLLDADFCTYVTLQETR